MEENYTKAMEHSVCDHGFLGDDYNDDEVIRFIRNPNSFRSFAEGLKTLFEKIGLSSDSTEMISLILNRFQAIQEKIERKTVSSWVLGTKRPKIEPKSRLKMYQLCFALNLSLENSIWFFHHVYYDIPFNYRKIDEAVYYFAIKNGIDYQTTKTIIKEIESSSCSDITYDDGIHNFTLFMREKLSKMDSTQELVDYISNNKPLFRLWNQTAYRRIDTMVRNMIGSESLKASIERYRNKLIRKVKASSSSGTLSDCVPVSDFFDCNSNECGLILREILFDAKKYDPLSDPDHDILKKIKNKDLFSNDFILQYIIGSASGISKQIDLPEVIKTNFPSKIVMSELLGLIHQKDTSNVPRKKIDNLETYDKIRKLIILLYFYTFWVNVKLTEQVDFFEPDDFDDAEKYYYSYIAETNELLCLCGYEDLFYGNPYDWIFLHCSNSIIDGEYPVYYFRDLVIKFFED